MAGLSDVRPGDLGFGPIHGAAGAGVGAGQLLLSLAEPGLVIKTKPREWWRKRHVIVVTEASRTLPPGTIHRGEAYETGVITAPLAVQAMPGGAEEIELRTGTHWTKEWTFIRPAYIGGSILFSQEEEDHVLMTQAEEVARAARGFVGTPYDFLTYGAIPLYRRGVRTERIKQIISGTDTMMCSRLGDAALEAAGWNVFDDGRMRGNVTPSELYRALLRQGHGPAMVLEPGRRIDKWWRN